MPAKPRRSAGTSKTSAKAAPRRTRAKAPRQRKGAATSVSRPATSPRESAIAERAYYLYLDRGASEGHALDDWLRAKHELSAAGGVIPEPAGPLGAE